MRWNCPHCGTNLAASDDRLSTGWSFSRCYKCAGFALVRLADANLIKVDRAPAGEKIILPEANEEPTAMLSQNAANHLARFKSNKTSPSIVKAAPRRSIAKGIASLTKPTLPTPVAAAPPAPPKTAAQILENIQTPSALGTAQRLSYSKPSPFGLPQPLPEVPERSLPQRVAPTLVGISGLLAIGSGIYLYVQGQALWENSRLRAAESKAIVDAALKTEISEAEPAPAQAEPIAPATAGSAAVESTPAPVRASSITDQVHANAMAPTRESEQKPAHPTSHQAILINATE